MELGYVRGRAGNKAGDLYLCALILEELLQTAIARLGDGPGGRAVRLLFGVEPSTRGRLLKDRRRLAAAELDLLTSSFRKRYEDLFLDDVAIEIWRICQPTVRGES